MCLCVDSEWDLVLHNVQDKTIKLNKKEKKYVQTRLKKAGQSINLRELSPGVAHAVESKFPEPKEKTFQGILKKAVYATF